MLRNSKLGVFVVLLLCSAIAAEAQVSTAEIVGKVLDPSGAVVTGAKVTAKNKDTGFTRETVSTASGDFALTVLPVGTYKVTVEASGFATTVYEKVELGLGSKVNLDVNLKLGSGREVVIVTEETPLIEFTRSDISGSVTPKEVKTLPVLDRNFAGLMTLIPGVRPAENFDPTKTRAGNITVNGSDGRAVDYNVDGGDNKDNVIGGIVQNFTMEGIQEFNVVTNRYGAESGRAVSAVVNVVSKSGTNSLHGTAFGLFQNSGLNAKPFFASEKPKFHRYQFGGSAGGPIIKDKLFVFGAYEQKREPGNIPVDPDAFAELSLFPLAEPISSLPFPYVDHLLTLKVDHQITDRQSMYYRYARERWVNPNDQLGNPFVTDLSQSNSDVNQFHDMVIAHTWAISSTKVNTITAHFQDFANSILASPGRTFTLTDSNGDTVTNPEICFKPNPGCGGGPPEVEIGQNVNVPQQTLIRKYQFRDDFSWTFGKHNLKFGVNYIYLSKLGGFFFFGASGYQITFWDDPSVILANPAIYPQGFATPGAVQELTFNGGSGSTAQPPAHQIGLYYQDDYRVTPHLTLNLGIRWDANPKFLVPQLTDDPLTTNRAIAVLQQLVAANPSSAAAQDGLARARDVVGDSDALRRTTADWKQFQPRLGFAWDPIGSGKLVIRGGYGIARDQIFQNLTLFSIQQGQPTIYQTLFDRTASATGTACLAVVPAPGPLDLCNFRFGIDPLPAAPAGLTGLVFGATGRITDPRITDPWAQQTSFGFAWQFQSDYSFSMDYYHILGTHEPRVLQLNPQIRTLCDASFPDSNPADARCVDGSSTRLLDAAFQDAGIGAGRLGELREYGTTNRSRYDGLNIRLQKRFSRNFQFQISDVISWSKTWGGVATSSYFGSGGNITPERQFLPNEFGPTVFDERNRFTASAVFNLPYGFSLAPIFQAASGRPFSAFAGDDIDGDGRATIDRICADGTLTPGCRQENVTTHRAMPFVQLDLRTEKTFKLRENLNFHVIWEFYNLFDRDNSCNFVDTNAGSTLGQPQGYCGGQGFGPGFSGPFRSQFGFRFEF